MKNNSRTKNTILNFMSSIGGQLITILMQFIVRTVFINTLGRSYLGINGLFTNILSMLSLAEMGVGSAIVFKLYEPISSKDTDRINSLMLFYKTIYRYIGIVVALIGICLIPFLPNLINDYDKLSSLNINAVVIYCIFLFDSVSSYLFFAYKSAIIKADQKEYYINVIGYIFTIGCGIAQIIGLILVKSFLLYVIITVVKTIGQNLVVALFADKQYPFLRASNVQKISRGESNGILKDCGALFLYRLNNVVVKSTDNIVLSAFIGLDAVALYSNYYIFYTSITSLLNKIYNSVGHSIGNLHTTHNVKKEYSVFESTILIAAILGGTVFTGIFAVSNRFIEVWIGKDWVLSQPFALLMGLELYTSSFKYAIAKYRTAYGLFKQGWMRPLFSMIINLIISVLLVRPLGIVGVLIGTLAADWLTFIWYDPIIVHKIGFMNQFPVSRYFFKFAKYTVMTILIGVVDYFICNNLIINTNWISVIICILICIITTPLALLIVSYHTPEAKYVKELGKNQLLKFVRRFRRNLNQ